MPLYELANPSDPYTFHAPNIEIAGAAAVLLSPSYGATCVDGSSDEGTPVLFGWQEWLAVRRIDDAWVLAHAVEIADALDSFLIGSKSSRADVESMLAMLPEDKRQEWKAARQDRHRSSTNQIGEHAYALAKVLRKRATESGDNRE